jgi:NADH:ubiquinone oxidoreductase subunit F (NADH-binding)
MTARIVREMSVVLELVRLFATQVREESQEACQKFTAALRANTRETHDILAQLFSNGQTNSTQSELLQQLCNQISWDI